jgi:class 3 adenylate cyclase
MCWGYANSKKPLATGRADYFGVLANTAARIMALAQPGQVRK